MSLCQAARIIHRWQQLPVCKQVCSLHTSVTQQYPRKGSRGILQQLELVDKIKAKEAQANQLQKPQFNPELEEFRASSAEELLKGAQVTTDEEPEPEFISDMMEDKEKFQVVKDKRSQRRLAFRPNVDPTTTSILLFPGQGSQFVGMGRELLDQPHVETMYAIASDILGYDLLDVCLNGPPEKLEQTIYQQPAVVVTSLAAVEKLKTSNPAVGECKI